MAGKKGTTRTANDFQSVDHAVSWYMKTFDASEADAKHDLIYAGYGRLRALERARAGKPPKAPKVKKAKKAKKG